MRIFIKHILIFLLPVVLIVISGEVLLRKIPNDYSYKSNYLNEASAKIRVLFLGNSHVFYGINPVFLKEKSFNAAHVSQSIKYDYEILNKYRWDSLQCIVLPVNYPSLNYQLETGVESWRTKDYSIYYKVPTTYAIADHSEIFSANLSNTLSRLYNFYIRKKTEINCSATGFGTLYSIRPQQDLISTGSEAAKRHTLSDAQTFNYNVDVLKAISEFAQKKKIKLVLFTCPAYKTYVQNLNADQLKQLTDVVNEIVNSSSNTYYFNFLNDAHFKAEDYYDADHLNGKGAEKLTYKIDSLINSAAEKKIMF